MCGSQSEKDLTLPRNNENHRRHFALDICYMPSPLFYAFPAMMRTAFCTAIAGPEAGGSRFFAQKHTMLSLVFEAENMESCRKVAAARE